MLTYKRLGLKVKPHLTEKDETVGRILDILKKSGAEVYVDQKSIGDIRCAVGLPILDDASTIDAMIVIGGDGTILRSVRELKDLSVPIFGINRGAVGFLAEIAIEEVETLLPSLLAGEGVIEERELLSVEVERSDKKIFDGFALNEIVVSQGAIARLMDLRTSVNGEALATYHADGLIIATPTGSTAYSLAAGGPVVHAGLSAMILTPINPHSLTQKPIVIPGDSIVETEIIKNNNEFSEGSISLTLDGQVYEQLNKNDIVRVRVHDETAKFIRRKQDTFFHTLRTKLRWGERI